jgi:hypothetical protein
VARDVNWRIVEDDDGLPHFTRSSQNIATIMALLRGLPEPTTPEDRRAHHEIHTLLRGRRLEASQLAPSRWHGKDVSVQQAPCNDGRRVAVLVHECIGPHRDARNTLDAHRRDGEMRKKVPTTATTLVAANATTAPRTRARAPLRRALRFSVSTSSMRLSCRGTNCR